MRIIDNTRPDRQTVMFSATFPRQMEALARRILNKPIEITVGGRSVVCADVEQHVLVIEDDQKFLKVFMLDGTTHLNFPGNLTKLLLAVGVAWSLPRTRQCSGIC